MKIEHENNANVEQALNQCITAVIDRDIHKFEDNFKTVVDQYIVDRTRDKIIDTYHDSGFVDVNQSTATDEM